jgi:hypothetical protein
MPLDNTSARPPIVTKPAVAMRYHLARTAATVAASENKKATSAAVKSGVIFDHKAHPEPAGTEREVYDDGEVRITLKVSEPSQKLDEAAFLAALGPMFKIPAVKLQRLVDKHTHDTAASHTFSSSLVA